MRNYRIGFWAALTANAILVAVVASLWTRMHTPTPTTEPAAPTGSASMSSSGSTQELAAGSAEAEPPLASLQIAPERLQSIGVSTGEVLSKRVEDYITTTGNVAVDETR